MTEPDNVHCVKNQNWLNLAKSQVHKRTEQNNSLIYSTNYLNWSQENKQKKCLKRTDPLLLSFLKRNTQFSCKFAPFPSNKVGPSRRQASSYTVGRSRPIFVTWSQQQIIASTLKTLDVFLFISFRKNDQDHRGVSETYVFSCVFSAGKATNALSWQDTHCLRNCKKELLMCLMAQLIQMCAENWWKKKKSSVVNPPGRIILVLWALPIFLYIQKHWH